MSGQHEVIGFLSRADSYGCPGGTVERIETHGSLIFLCGERVYKLKREIAYASLDFLTLEKREGACHAELRLNRRTAPGLYLRVSAITRGRAGVLAFDADGEVLDWVVVMRRFPQSALFDRMALAGELTPSLMQTLGVEVARFHAGAERTPAFGGSAGIRRSIETNHQELRRQCALLDGRRRAEERVRLIGRLPGLHAFLDYLRAGSALGAVGVAVRFGKSIGAVQYPLARGTRNSGFVRFMTCILPCSPQPICPASTACV